MVIMVHSVTPEDDIKILDKKRNAKRFLYQGLKQKSNPWSQFEDNLENFQFTGFSENSLAPKLISSNGNANKNEIHLQDVWSIRNISLTNMANPEQPISKTNTYSRHKKLLPPIKQHSNQQQRFLPPTNLKDGEMLSDSSSDIFPRGGVFQRKR